MSGFHDVLFPNSWMPRVALQLAYPTQIATVRNGHEVRSQTQGQAQRQFDCDEVIAPAAQALELHSFYSARRGPLFAFRLVDPMDSHSQLTASAPTAMDQVIGVGNGVQSTFRLTKTYTSQTISRRITCPRPGSVVVSVNGVATPSFSVDSNTGSIVMQSPPATGAVVRAGFRFDVPVRFASEPLRFSPVSPGQIRVGAFTLTEVTLP